jgi:hypothetical protein
MAVPTKRRHRLLLALALSIAAMAAATLVWGSIGFAIAFPVGLLGTAWYGDDKLGTCLPLAVMFLIAALVMVVLVAMLLFFHPA